MLAHARSAPSSCRCRSAARPSVSRRAAVASVRAAVGSQQAIKVVSNVPDSKLKELGVRSWPTWGCGVSKFPWSYSENETCYVLEGRVFVTPDGGEPVEIKQGDMATFPAGMSCVWDVKEAINKHYNFH